MARPQALRAASSRASMPAFERRFEAMRRGYSRSLDGLIKHRFVIPSFMLLLLALGVVTFPFVGRDFFPAIDGGQIQLHVRAPAGTRIEATEKIFQQVENKIREIIPESDRELIVDNIGLPARAYNLAFTDGSTIGVNDGVILVSLKEGHAPTSEYVRKLRAALPAAFPEEHVLFSGGRHRHPDPQFRPAGANRRPHGRLRQGQQSARCQGAAPADRGDTGHRGCASAAGSRCTGVLCRYRSHACRPARAQCGHHRHQRQCQPELVGAGDAEFLDRSQIGNSVLSRGADAREQDQLAERSRATRRSRPGYPRP